MELPGLDPLACDPVDKGRSGRFLVHPHRPRPPRADPRTPKWCRHRAGTQTTATDIAAAAILSGRFMTATQLLSSVEASPGTAFAQRETPSTQEEAAPAVKHFDFEDDLVEGDLQRPDGELVTSIPKATQPSLIELRWGFLPEIIKDFENL